MLSAAVLVLSSSRVLWTAPVCSVLGGALCEAAPPRRRRLGCSERRPTLLRCDPCDPDPTRALLLMLWPCETDVVVPSPHVFQRRFDRSLAPRRRWRRRDNATTNRAVTHGFSASHKAPGWAGLGPPGGGPRRADEFRYFRLETWLLRGLWWVCCGGFERSASGRVRQESRWDHFLGPAPQEPLP